MVKPDVKPAAVPAVITILAIPVIAEVIALVNTTIFLPFGPATAIPGHRYLDPPQIPISSPNLPPGNYQTNPLFDPGIPVPGHGSPSPKSLAPGVYETKPYAMMLKVPNPMNDSCVIHHASPSPMPIKHPELEVIPKVMPVLPVKK